MSKLALNKRARFDYDLLETLEGGLVLSGPEVKSIKNGRCQLKGTFLHFVGDELWLKNAHIAKYEPAGEQADYHPARDRKVLLHKKQLKRLIGRVQADGLTLVPISLYTHRGLIKLEFALARGKKQFEKRDSIKKRDVERHIRQKMLE